MFSGIDPRNPTPLYLQIAESVRRSIGNSELVPGDTLPTARALATRLRVNPSAVTQAYRELVRDGLVVEDGEGSQAIVRVARTTGPRDTQPGAVSTRGTAIGATSAQLEPGTTVEARFLIRRRLGAGAMGAVYLAKDLDLDEDIALKVLPPSTFHDETSVKRFINEVRIARRISHRNVVRTHDVGRWEGGLFLTMEYVAGRSLRHELDARGTLPPREAAQIGLQLVDALATAHAEGVVHRDVKPQNLVLDTNGVLKVLDFGIAVIEGTSGQLTEAGLVVGTPAYMSPEQLLGDAVGPAADLYATGVVLYECLSGALPYESSNPLVLAAQIVERGPMPLEQRTPSIPEPFVQLIAGLLHRSPGSRPTAPEVVQQLRALG